MNPIICIGNYYIDKKIRELMKVCNIFEIKTPTPIQISNLLTRIMPNTSCYEKRKNELVAYIQGDMRKVLFVHDIYKKKPEILDSDALRDIF